MHSDRRGVLPVSFPPPSSLLHPPPLLSLLFPLLASIHSPFLTLHHPTHYHILSFLLLSPLSSSRLHYPLLNHPPSYQYLNEDELRRGVMSGEALKKKSGERAGEKKERGGGKRKEKRNSRASAYKLSGNPCVSCLTRYARVFRRHSSG